MRPSEIRPSHIADAAKLPLGLLLRVAHDPCKHFKPTRHEQIGDKLRPLDVPKYWLKTAYKRIHRFLQAEISIHGAAHGGVRGKSCFTAAEKHLAKVFLITRDIKDCYPNVTTAALKGKLIGMGFRRDVAWLLANLMTLRNGIPQGSPLSGDALNLFLYDSDSELTDQFADSADVTRSADDIVVSSNDLTLRSDIEAAIERQIESHCLTVNVKKKTERGFQTTTNVQLVHNIQVNSALGTKICPDHTIQAVNDGLNYVRAARQVTPDSLAIVAQLRQKVHGWMHYCRQATHGPARYVRGLLGTGDRLVCNTLRRADVTRSKKWWVKSKRCDRPAEFGARWRNKRKASCGNL